VTPAAGDAVAVGLQGGADGAAAGDGGADVLAVIDPADAQADRPLGQFQNSVHHRHHRRAADRVARHGPPVHLELGPLDDARAHVPHDGAAHRALLRRGRGDEQLPEARHRLRGREQPRRLQPVVVGDQDQRRLRHGGKPTAGPG
jgi:hypothetical protein